jgi:UDP-N-acetylmuramoyl-L-alanine---L-glutamate ligase
MLEKLQQYVSDVFSGKKIVILGFGREGKSTYRILRQCLPHNHLYIADFNHETPAVFEKEFPNETRVSFSTGTNYLDILALSDVIVKSPGISFKHLEGLDFSAYITSQTEIFLSLFKDQVIGATGTKGKSTTVRVLYHILKTAGRKALLGGNIGVPPLEMAEKMDPDTVVVFEMSSHQLEGINMSPRIAILLNIFQEHLDHYKSYRDYQLAKLNITRWQNKNDSLICNMHNPVVSDLVSEFSILSERYYLNEFSPHISGAMFSDNNLIITNKGNQEVIHGMSVALPGSHNLINVAAASLAAHLVGVSNTHIKEGVSGFTGLPHRLEKAGEINGAMFYNDSISTIPEATIEALKAFPDTQTLILGGFDRGVDYTILCRYLIGHPVENLIFLGNAGKRMHNQYHELKPLIEQTFLVENFDNAVIRAIMITRPGKICLLSPAASSYDEFRNFEERGRRYKQIIQDHASDAC